MAALAANVTTMVALGLLFGNPLVEAILYTDAAGQSPKVLAVFFELEPLPAVSPLWDDALEISTRGLAVRGFLLLWSLGLVAVFAVVMVPRPGRWPSKGLQFGVAVWAIVFLFFEAYVPFNMFGEPFRLVALELGLELVAMILTGMVIAAIIRPTHASPAQMQDRSADGTTS